MTETIKCDVCGKDAMLTTPGPTHDYYTCKKGHLTSVPNLSHQEVPFKLRARQVFNRRNNNGT